MDELDGSTVIWAIMAVTGLWLVGLLSWSIGYTLDACIGPCSEPAPRWVWWLTSLIAAGAFVMSGRVAVRMTHLTWAWASVIPGMVFLAVAWR